MRWSHLRATLWLRWRILANRVRRASRRNTALFALLIAIGLALSAGLFAFALMEGISELPGARPLPLMAVWLGLTLAFLFSWTIGLVTDLQRSDAMSFRNLLHLPVSLGWVFLYNYLSSWVSLSVALFVPAMLGLCLAMVIVHGPALLLAFPLLLGFLAMVTALTYQLRGWLARMMEDKRRARSVVATVTVTFVLLLQLPNLVNLGLSRSRRAEQERARVERVVEEGADAETAAVREALARRRTEREEELAAVDRWLSLGAQVVPVGWLPYGVRAAFERRFLAGGLCVLGMFAIAAWSLTRSFRTTLAAAVGEAGGAGRAATVAPTPAPARAARKTPFLERRLPLAGEAETAIALAGLRSLLRAPEARMVLLGPVLLLGIMGFLLATSPSLPRMRAFAPMLSLGAITMGLLSIGQLMQNQFGLDRAGFRTWVLSPVPRERILLGKNLATAPLAVGIGLAALVGLQFFVPAGPAHFPGACLQLVSAYLLLCLVGNAISIFGPMRLREHGMRAANVKLKTVLWQLVSLVLVPLAFAPLLLPSGIELLLRRQAWARAVPLHLMLHAALLGAVWLVYRRTVRWQGELLHEREQRILDVLTRD